jgi:hypothetical protein
MLTLLTAIMQPLNLLKELSNDNVETGNDCTLDTLDE